MRENRSYSLGRLIVPALFVLGACSNDVVAQEDSATRQLRAQLGAESSPVDPAIARALSNAFRAAADRALPAVVQVTIERPAQMASRRQPQIPEEFQRFFGIIASTVLPVMAVSRAF